MSIFMATLTEDTAGKIRDLPIKSSLKRILIAAADLAGVDHVSVYSGGQRPAPHPKRIGSVRHDDGNAADLQLFVNGRIQSFETSSGRTIMAAYCKACAALGATGIGCGPGYMGPNGIHVGYGSKAVWGAGGHRANAPSWLVRAVTDGWQNPIPIDNVRTHAGDDGDRPDRYVVNARPSLRLRSGPGVSFPRIGSIPTGRAVTVMSIENDWALVDILADGVPDGYVHAAFLAHAA